MLGLVYGGPLSDPSKAQFDAAPRIPLNSNGTFKLFSAM